MIPAGWPAALSSGLAPGFLVAAQVGPIWLLWLLWLLCALTALRHGLLGGLAVGLGAALVDTAYACLALLSPDPPPSRSRRISAALSVPCPPRNGTLP